MVVSALCAEVGLTESSNSMSDSLVRPMIRSCASVDSAFHPSKIVEIFLNDDVAAAGERGVLVADEHGIDHRLAPRILRPVDETQEIAVVKVTEAMHFVYRRNSISDTRHDLHSKFEAQIHTLGANVEQQVAWRGNRMARSCANFAEHVQFRRPRRAKEPVPRVGPKAKDAGEARFEVAKFHRAQQCGEVSAERPHGRPIVESRVECHHQEDGGAGERRGYWLRNGPQTASRFGRAHRIGLHLDVILAWHTGFRSLKEHLASAKVVDKLTNTEHPFAGTVLSA